MLLSTTTSLYAAPGSPPGQEKHEVLIGFHVNTNRGLVSVSGGEVTREFTLVKVIAARLPQQAIDALSKNPHISFIEEDSEVRMIAQSLPWGIDRVYGPEKYPFLSWQQPVERTINVAVLDTGIDLYHTDLPAILGGVNTIDTTHWGSDGNGHGTHVAGTIAALDNTTGVVGAAPGIGLYAVKVLNDNGSGTVSSVIAGIEWATNNNIEIINMSLGTTSSTQSLKDAVDAAYGRGILLVAAAGNSGSSATDNVIYPARYSSVIAVSASDSSNKIASFSSVGPSVELIAPGVNILSTIPGGYSYGSGTSMASPHVAGVAARTWSVNRTLSNTGLRQILTSTAQNLNLPASHQGYGLVRADLAIAAAAQKPVTPVIYTLQLSFTGEGTLNPAPGIYEYEENSLVEISAIAAEGWYFTGWEGDVANPASATTTISISGNLAVSALFEADLVQEPAPEEEPELDPEQDPEEEPELDPEQDPEEDPEPDTEPEPDPVIYTLQVSVGGSGSVDPATGSHEYEEGRVVNLTATPADGWLFKEWKGEVEDAAAVQTTVLLDGNKDVRAEFEAIGPAAPILRAPADGAIVVGTAITFSWNKTSGANRYQLELVNAADDSVYRTVTLKNVASYKMTKLPNNGTEFKWRVRSGNSNTWGEWSEQRTLINNALPTAPTLRLPAADAIVAGKTISFAWNRADRAASYQIEVVNTAEDSVFSTVTLKNVTSYKMTKFPNTGATYKWRVRASNALGWGEWSEYSIFTNNALPSAPALRAPADAAIVVGTTVSFSWYKASWANKYEIEVVNAADDSTFRTVALKNVTSYKMGKFPNNGTAYKWRVRGGNNVGWGEWSEYRTFTNNDLPPAPSQISLADNAVIKGLALTFRWSAAARATGYQLEIIRADSETVFKTVNLKKVTSFKQTGFKSDGTVYQWRIRAKNALGWGDWSDYRTFTN